MTRSGVAILGAGRMGQGLALALQAGGHRILLIPRTSHPLAPPLQAYAGSRADAVREAAVVLLAVPDVAVTRVAEDLAVEDGVGPLHVVLHLSGLLDRRALAPLEASGAALGSFHPLQSIADPASAPERLRGAYAGVEGDDRALAAGGELAGSLGMTAVPIPPSAKAAYHAGATIAANFTTVLAAVAERLATSAGVEAGVARRLYLPLLRGAAANLEAGAAAALTGPFRRGDAETVAAHLAVLTPADRELYLPLAWEALRLSRDAGLAPEAAARVASALEGDAPQR